MKNKILKKILQLRLPMKVFAVPEIDIMLEK